MTFESITKIENPLILIFSIFYGVVGITQIGYFVIESSVSPPHIPILGILNLITAYTLFRMKKWTLPLGVGLFLVGITFGVITLSNSITLQTFGGDLPFQLALIIYIFILFISSIYIVTRRETFS